jgi:Na+/melibiose symporter-like transporter
MAGVVILAGHYIDFFNMIMPGSVTDGLLDFRNCFCSFLPWIIYFCCFTALTKNPLLPKEILSLKK